MDRTEAKGFGIALAGHAALLAALSMGLATSTRPPVLNEPMEVSLVEEVALESSAPSPAREAPAPKLAEVEGPVEPAPPTLPVPEPEPLPQPKAIEPVPPPSPRPAERPRPPKPAPPQPKPAPAKPSPPKAAPKAVARAETRPAPKPANRPTGRLKGLLDGVGEQDTDSRASAPPAATISAAARSSLAAEVRRQLKPHWKPPTGADVELLRTEMSITLAPNGSLTNVQVIRTTGQTDSNRPQVKLHQEQAVRAARIASPFRLPADLYEAWKQINIDFDARLAR